ncbi:hypothetical protein RB195_025491 [Necator americanus]|uniref:Uncharacterized protein n=1 Tax=Necator americanus TaxID=51031 RepID=A0ABR1ESJ5_NECAM
MVSAAGYGGDEPPDICSGVSRVILWCGGCAYVGAKPIRKFGFLADKIVEGKDGNGCGWFHFVTFVIAPVDVKGIHKLYGVRLVFDEAYGVFVALLECLQCYFNGDLSVSHVLDSTLESVELYCRVSVRTKDGWVVGIRRVDQPRQIFDRVGQACFATTERRHDSRIVE